MVDFSKLVIVDNEVLRRELDLRAVAELYGVQGVELGLVRCPFHDDSRPSFSIFRGDDEAWRAMCHSCGWHGDVIDFIGEQESLLYPDARRHANVLWRDGLQASVPEPLLTRRTSVPGEWNRLAQESFELARECRFDVVRELLGDEAGVAIAKRWWLGIARDVEALVIPHCNSAGVVTAVKLRRHDGAKKSVPGSRLVHLYGEWLDARQPTVVLCEGESDTWAASWWLRDHADAVSVLGLPRGAGARVMPSWLELLAGRSVYLPFDNDEAGWKAAVRWSAELGTVASVFPVWLPDGTDLREAGREALLAALTRAREQGPVRL